MVFFFNTQIFIGNKKFNIIQAFADVADVNYNIGNVSLPTV